MGMRQMGVAGLFAVLGLAYGSTAGAQTMDDLVLYSQEDITGSARAVGLGGAMGAVGGDVVSMAGNPAGFGMYRGLEFSASGGLGGHSVRTDFVDNKYISRRIVPSFDGAVVALSFRVGDAMKTNGLLRVNFGVGYNKLQSYRYRQTYSGEVADRNSLLAGIASVANAQGLEAYNLMQDSDYNPYESQPWYPTAAYGSYLMLDGPVVGTFKSPWILDGEGYVDEKLRQSAVVDSKGSLGEVGLSIAFNLSNKFYIGTTLGIQMLNRELTTQLREETAEEKTEGLKFGEFLSKEVVSGTGVNFKLGLLYRPIDALRLGVAFHTPTFISAKNVFSLDAKGLYQNPDTAYGEPDAPNTEAKSGEFDGKFSYTSPLRALVSVAYSFEKLGLISADYEMTYMPLMQFAGIDYEQDNRDIEQHLIPTHEARLGTEWFAGSFGFRVGGGFRTSAYRSEEFAPRRWRWHVAAGIGYYGRLFFFDFAYKHVVQPGEGYMYWFGDYRRAYGVEHAKGQGIFTLGMRF